MKTKLIISTLGFCLLTNNIFAQVLIAANGSSTQIPDKSAVLHIENSSRGLLLPNVSLLNNTDQTTVPSPVNGVLVFNTKIQKLNFWSQGKWNRNFEISDTTNIIKSTNNETGASSAGVVSNTFPTQMPLFNIDDPATDWTDLGTSTTVTITKPQNTAYIIAEGMTQANNSQTTNQQYQYAIAVFVDNKLKIVRKYQVMAADGVCVWNKFNLSGVFYDLSVGTHTVKIYGRNLPKPASGSSGYTTITYGAGASGCSNLNSDMAKIFVTAQTTQ